MKNKITYYNCHTHRKPQSENEFCIRNAYLNAPDANNGNYTISNGLHPWFASNYSSSEIENILTNLAKLPKNLAIGEIGLDKMKPHFEKQMTVFLQQLEIAEKFKKPLIIHQVKAYEEILPLLRSYKGKVVLHGFQGNVQQWEQLNKNGNVYVSFGAAILGEKGKTKQTLNAIPLSYLLTETDNAPLKIDRIYNTIAAIKQIPILDLAQQIELNFRGVFGSNLNA